MQRVVRSTLVGLLTVAGLTACGDKITIPPPTTIPVSTVVREVTVSPSNVTIPINGTAQLAASVNADAGVTDRTVTWTTSSATIATVDANGLVTGKAAGVATITAASKADPSVKAAAAITVTGAGNNPTVIITGINQTNGAGQSVPVNINAAAGQIDVILDVNTNGAQLRTVSATLACSNGTSMTQTQTISGAASDVEGAAVPVVLSFQTAAFNPTTGVPTLRNGPCTLTASATTGSSTTPQTAQTTTQLTLLNADGVVLTTSFAGYTNAEGVTTITQANDAGGLPWRGGAVTVSAVPVLYSGRTLSSVSITLPGANTPTQTLTAAPFSATWSATSTNSPNVTRLTLVGAGFEANGTTPLGITPSVVVLDNAGNDLNVGVLNAGVVGQTTFRLDNQPPQPPTTFIIAQRQFGWANASYSFTGTGGTSFGATGTTKYVACGDGPAAAAANPPTCSAQVGVSAAAVSGNSGTNGQTTFTYYSIPAANYAAINATGTAVTGTACSTTGWTKITNAGDLAETLVNTAYVVRVFESDKLLNARCTDLANAQNLINSTTAFANGTFGVDKTAPTATLATGGTADCTGTPGVDVPAGTSPNSCTTDQQRINPAVIAANGGVVPSFFTRYIDNPLASGFSTTPLQTTLTRLAINPATGAASTTSTAFGCPIGFNANNADCVIGNQVAGGTIAADAGGTNGVSSTVDGYYTYTARVIDNARNTGNTVTRSVVVDRAVPTMGGIAVPATLVGGSSASFATSATDNLDLVSTNYTLAYAITPAGAAQPVNIRANGNDIGVAFDNVLTTAASFSLNVPFFIRSVATTTAGGAPQNNAALASQISVRVVDAAGNNSAAGVSPIQQANLGCTGPATCTPALTNFTAAQANGATFTGTGFSVSNVATNISNCPGATCAGGVAPANATSVTITATAQGTESAVAPAFQFQSPFTQVQFYYLDPNQNNEWILIGSSGSPSGSDNQTQTVRTYNWSVSFDPPASLGSGVPLNVIAVGVNANGDALATAQNSNINLTNP